MTARRWLALLLLVVLPVAAACAGDDDGPTWPRVTPTANPAQTPAATTTPSPPAPEPTELTVAYINLMAPLAAVDANAAVAGETLDQRLEMVIAELKTLKPDVAIFSEASWTKYGKVIERLVRELKMEAVYERANPWVPGKTRKESDELTRLLEFEEGELVLVRAPFVILGSEPKELSPRSSELGGERRIVLHVRLGGSSVGDIHLFVTHLTGSDPRVLEEQTRDLLNIVSTQRGNEPAILVGDLSSVPDSPAAVSVMKAGFLEAANAKQLATCCRAGILGEQPPLELRHDYLFGAGWAPTAFGTFLWKPRQRANGSLLWASDHHGIIATFKLPPPIGIEP